MLYSGSVTQTLDIWASDDLSYSWSFVSKPDGSSAVFDDPTSVHPSFTADLEGTYEVSLVVSDGPLVSGPDNLIIVATYIQDQLVQKLVEAQQVISGLTPDNFKNKNWQRQFLLKIKEVIAKINKGDYQGALDKLENDILAKTDGCAGADSPDRNDKIITCDAQNQVYPLLIEAIELLRELI